MPDPRGTPRQRRHLALVPGAVALVLPFGLALVACGWTARVVDG